MAFDIVAILDKAAADAQKIGDEITHVLQAVEAGEVKSEEVIQTVIPLLKQAAPVIGLAAQFLGFHSQISSQAAAVAGHPAAPAAPAHK